eukprot:TRINITY_DN5372_c1_g1_i1.p1 TRINITY_DN5372_c1_g1~~TRINITY_DN5372_c1_g1_i1.p1  ORF type:complete len:294 (-),score=71.00 TRINITY_DN5372_c1_g1_i1:3-884(-)
MASSLPVQVPDELIPSALAVGAVEATAAMADEFRGEASAPGMLAKAEQVAASHPRMRRILRDGNCLYRCFAVALATTASGRRVARAVFRRCAARIVALGYPEMTTVMFFEEADAMLQEIETGAAPADNDVEYAGCADEPADEYAAGIQKIWSDAAAGSWNASAALAPEDGALDPAVARALAMLRDPAQSLNLIMCLRMVVSCHVIEHEDEWLPFLMGDGHDSARSWCGAESDRMGIEGGQVQLVALGREFLCRVRVAYLAGGGELSTVEVPEDGDGPVIADTLFRPGHYDVLL